jgi:MYXO-CTERM domain-containing protein
MRKNSMTKCAVGALLFGGTLGMSQAASAGLVFNLNGPSPEGATAGTLNYASGYDTDSTYVYLRDSNLGAKTLTLSTGLSASWTATSDSTGFVTTLTAPQTNGFSSYISTQRSFTVSGTQQITLNWSGSQSIILGQYLGGAVNNTGSWSKPITAAGWLSGGTGSPWGSLNQSSSGTLTTTLSAGTYWLNSSLDGSQAGASFSFAVPAPGAVALLGVAGIVGARRRRA